MTLLQVPASVHAHGPGDTLGHDPADALAARDRHNPIAQFHVPSASDALGPPTFRSQETGNRAAHVTSKGGEVVSAVTQQSAEIVVSLVAVYTALGLCVAVPFVWRLVERLDRSAVGGTWGFRLLIVPGVVALWPYLLARLLRGATAPPDEWTAHRRIATRGTR